MRQQLVVALANTLRMDKEAGNSLQRFTDKDRQRILGNKKAKRNFFQSLYDGFVRRDRPPWIKNDVQAFHSALIANIKKNYPDLSYPKMSKIIPNKIIPNKIIPNKIIPNKIKMDK